MNSRDPLDRAARSALMAKVRSRGNASTELVVARVLRRRGITGWRRHMRVGGVRPDFYFPKAPGGPLAVFVHGCWFHGCPRHYRPPKGDSAAFWRDKVQMNRARDARALRRLRRAGARTITVWEHELKGQSWVSRLERRLAEVRLADPA